LNTKKTIDKDNTKKITIFDNKLPLKIIHIKLN
jgi:hypothetical protein